MKVINVTGCNIHRLSTCLTILYSGTRGVLSLRGDHILFVRNSQEKTYEPQSSYSKEGVWVDNSSWFF